MGAGTLRRLIMSKCDTAVKIKLIKINSRAAPRTAGDAGLADHPKRRGLARTGHVRRTTLIRVSHCEDHRGPQVLELRDIDQPVPDDDEVLVRGACGWP
jgi:hypothetical protein